MRQQLSPARDQKKARASLVFPEKPALTVFVSCWGGGLQQTAERDALEFINSKDVLCAYVLLHAGKVGHHDPLQHVSPMQQTC